MADSRKPAPKQNIGRLRLVVCFSHIAVFAAVVWLWRAFLPEHMKAVLGSAGLILALVMIVLQRRNLQKREAAMARREAKVRLLVEEAQRVIEQATAAQRDLEASAGRAEAVLRAVRDPGCTAHCPSRRPL